MNLDQWNISGSKVDIRCSAESCCIGDNLAHNHPSGNLQPSQQDINLTRKIKEGGKLLEIQLLDHIIATCEGYYSFADEGLL